MFVTNNNAELFVMPSRLKSHIILVLDRLQCVARVNCLVVHKNMEIHFAQVGTVAVFMYICNEKFILNGVNNINIDSDVNNVNTKICTYIILRVHDMCTLHNECSNTAFVT